METDILIENINKQLIVTKKLDNNDGYTWTIASRLGETIHLAEEFFGERDTNYTILGVEFVSSEQPQIWYPGNRKHIIIQLTKESLLNEFQAFFQLSFRYLCPL